MEKKRKKGGKGGVPCTGKNVLIREEETEESRGKRSGGHSQAMRSAVRMEEELNRGAEEESRRVLWQRGARRSMVARIRVVYPGNDSNL